MGGPAARLAPGDVSAGLWSGGKDGLVKFYDHQVLQQKREIFSFSTCRGLISSRSTTEGSYGCRVVPALQSNFVVLSVRRLRNNANLIDGNANVTVTKKPDRGGKNKTVPRNAGGPYRWRPLVRRGYRRRPPSWFHFYAYTLREENIVTSHRATKNIETRQGKSVASPWHVGERALEIALRPFLAVRWRCLQVGMHVILHCR